MMENYGYLQTVASECCRFWYDK